MRTILNINTIASLTLLLSSASARSTSVTPEALVVYTSQKEHIAKPIFEAFTKETGIPLQGVYTDAAPLVQKLEAEGKSTPADVYTMADVGNAWLASEKGLSSPLKDKVLEDTIPSHLRDPSGRWFGISMRARTIAYNPTKVKDSDLSTYEDLGNPKWKGRLCLRSSANVYNMSLVAMLIAQHGEKKTQEVVKGWVANLAAPPFSSDTELLKAIAAGQCDVGLSNTYYLGRLVSEAGAQPIKLFWPNQAKEGVHVNVVAAGLTQATKNRKAAVTFLEWMVSEKAQKLIADSNFEWPVRKGVEPSELVKAWGNFKPSTLNLSLAGKNQPAAVKLMNGANYR
jgi:iron(III) transport system substrate-binding protein